MKQCGEPRTSPRVLVRWGKNWMWPVRVLNCVLRKHQFPCVLSLFELTVGYRFNQITIPIQIQIIRMNDLLMFKMKEKTTNWNRMSQIWCNQWNDSGKYNSELHECVCVSFFLFGLSKTLRSNKFPINLIKNFWTERMKRM